MSLNSFQTRLDFWKSNLEILRKEFKIRYSYEHWSAPSHLGLGQYRHAFKVCDVNYSQIGFNIKVEYQKTIISAFIRELDLDQIVETEYGEEKQSAWDRFLPNYKTGIEKTIELMAIIKRISEMEPK